MLTTFLHHHLFTIIKMLINKFCVFPASLHQKKGRSIHSGVKCILKVAVTVCCELFIFKVDIIVVYDQCVPRFPICSYALLYMLPRLPFYVPFAPSIFRAAVIPFLTVINVYFFLCLSVSYAVRNKSYYIML